MSHYAQQREQWADEMIERRKFNSLCQLYIKIRGQQPQLGRIRHKQYPELYFNFKV